MAARQHRRSASAAPSLPAAQLEIYQFGDAALAILVRGLTLSTLRTQPQITELASNRPIGSAAIGRASGRCSAVQWLN